MVVDFSGGALAGLWSVLHDDHHTSNHWGIQVWPVSVRDQAGAVLCALYSDSAEAVRCSRNLLFSACSGCAYDFGLLVFC